MGKQYVEAGRKAFDCAAATAQYLMMTKTAVAGQVGICGAVNEPLGVNIDGATFNAGERVTVKLLSGNGTFPCVASGVIAAGALVYTDAGGKIGTTGTNQLVGIALDAAAADGDIIEVMPK